VWHRSEHFLIERVCGVSHTKNFVFSDVQLPMTLQINDECYTLVCTADGTPVCGDDASKIAYMRDKGNYDDYFPQLHLLKQLTLLHNEFFSSALPVQAGPGLQ